MLYLYSAQQFLGQCVYTLSFFMAKPLKLADQFVCSDTTLQKAFIAVANEIDEVARAEVWRFYNDEQLFNAYRAWRNFNSMGKNGKSKKGYSREIIRIPSGRVYEFLQRTFEPKYGTNWLQNKKVLRHELIRPWWIVERL